MHLSDTEYDPYLQNVNNVGTINKNDRIWEVPVEEFEIMIDVNLKGIVNVLRHFISLMLPKSRRVTVNISSGYGKIWCCFGPCCDGKISSLPINFLQTIL
ncbi:hypothetical protein V6Z11_A06G117600 [Gossypium hirsutum]